MNHKTAGGLASLSVPCCNQLDFTRQCISALRHCTRPPWELIVIDNGSTDGTAVYLSGVQDAAAVPVTVISNRENRGFPAAINQGLQQARGENPPCYSITTWWLPMLGWINLLPSPPPRSRKKSFNRQGR